HYWMLHFWNMLAGANAFAGRFLSVAFGVLTIALLYRIGTRVGGAWIGWLAAAFLAVARFHIWWSQDIKNYTPSIFFAFAAVWFALELIADSRWQMADPSVRHSPFAIRYSLLGYALCAALALWTHYLAALVLLALNVYAVFVFATDKSKIENRKSKIINWLIANLIAAALFAPWMYLYLENAAAWSAAPTFDFSLFLKLVATVLPLGVTTNIDNYAWLTIALTAIAALGCIPQKAESRRQKAEDTKRLLPTAYCLLPALIVTLPPVLIYALSLTPVSFFAPKIQARYLLILLPAYVILLALGIAALRRFSVWLALAATLFVFAASAFVLNDYYADRRLTDDYATLTNTINSFARQGDIVLLDTDQEWPTFLYYLRAPLDWLGASNGKPMDAGAADALVQRALARSNAVWLVAIPDALATDPQHLLETRLARELGKQYERTVGDKRLVLYAPAPRDFVNIPRDAERFAPQYVLGEMVGGATLLGFDLPTREVDAGDTLRLVTYWRAAYPAMVSVRVAGLITTTLQMPAGDLMRYENDFAIPPNASGDFAVTVNQRELARVHIQPRAPIANAGSIAHPTDFLLGDAIHLVGYDLPNANYRAGESVPLTLYWRADRPIEKSYTAFVHLVGAQFNPQKNNPLWGQIDRVPRDGAAPTTAWEPNEIVPDPYRVPIDPGAPAGTYKIEVGLYDPATGARLAVAGGGDSVMVAEIEITR
ncbi:MAG: glycosyltransferase family 39 protein, partial [Chloroflexota bacterium]|nr:glycosyltransferase family 39 protein [Chloroflexota bacterium]